MPAAEKKVPVRQCLGCGEHKPKAELIRVVRAPDESISLDFKGKKSGRGAYLCPSLVCLRRARKNGRIGNNLGVAVPEEIWDALEAEMESRNANGTD